jgi:hypothetical protein
MRARFVPVAFVKVTPPSEERPDILRDAPEKYPEAVTFEPDALVKKRLGKRPYPLAVRLVEDTAARLDWPETTSEAPCTKPLAAKLVADADCKLVCPDTVSVVETVVVASCATPVSARLVPVAFVKVNPAIEERPEMLSVAPWRNPEAVILVLDTDASVACPLA